MQSQLMLQISDMIIPALVFYIIAMGLASMRDIYSLLYQRGFQWY